MFGGRYVFGRKRSPVVRVLGLDAVASGSGGALGFAVSAIFLDRFVGFCTKNLRIFGFGYCCGLRFLFYFALGFRQK